MILLGEIAENWEICENLQNLPGFCVILCGEIMECWEICEKLRNLQVFV